MIPNGRQSINKQDIKAVSDVFSTGWLTQGPAVRKFEESIAKYVGAKHGVAVCNGTAALHIAYLAAGLKKGDEVITTPITFAATSNMLLVTGVKPVFCDINPDTFNIDETKIEKLITKKTKAIVPVHMAGHPCEMDKIWRIAKKHKLKVIEDGAQALGARFRGKYIGGGKSDMTMYSFHPVKPITTGEGGVIVTNDKKLYERLLLYRTHGIIKNRMGLNVMTELGFNYRLSDIHASLGLSQLPRLEKFLQKRHQVAKWYKQGLKDVYNIILPKEIKHVYSGWHLYIIRTKNKKDKKTLFAHLQKNGIGVNFHFPAVYKHPYYRKNGFAKVHNQNADLYHDTAITLPMHTHLTQEQIIFISNQIKNYFNK